MLDTKSIDEKFDLLKDELKSLKRVAIAFSAGVDSTFLLKVAKDVLGEDVLAITVKSNSYSKMEFEEALYFTKINNIDHRIIKFNELDLLEFVENSKDRCYYCKKEIFEKIFKEAKANNYNVLLDGANKDDLGDYRPGMKATEELGVKSILLELNFSKDEIRYLSKKIGLETHNKPSMACLASRIPYGDNITKDKLKLVESAEMFLWENGFRGFRVRVHRKLARIELSEKDIIKFIKDDIRVDIVNHFKSLGFEYVSLDLEGYKMGSLNREIL